MLYKWSGHSGLPSLTAASLQTEAYLRFAKVDFCVQDCSSASSSPTGVIPAVDTGSDIPAATELGDLAAARAILAALAKSNTVNLDAGLSPAQRAELLAFVTLVTARLDVATHYTTWLEPRGFREFRKAAYGSALPFPLSYLVPWSQRAEMKRLLGHVDGFKAYQDTVQALSAVSDRLRASSGRFFFGDRPSSLDALLFGHMAFYKHSPVAAPVLRDKVDHDPMLSRYVDGILSDFFSTEMPPPPADDPSTWSDAAQGATSPPKHTPTVEEGRMWRGSQYWLAGAAAAVGAYVVLGGQYFTITTSGGDEEELEEVEVEEDDGDEDVE